MHEAVVWWCIEQNEIYMNERKKKLLARTLVSCRRQEHGTISLLCYISFSVCFVWFIDFSEDYL